MQLHSNHMRKLGARMIMTTAISLAATQGASAQGLTYDMKVTMDKGTAATPANGDAQIMMAGHGQFSGGSSRMDMQESTMPGGMMSKGTYIILKNGSRNEWIVDPDKKQYTEINIDSAASFALASQNMVGGLVKMSTSDAKADVQSLGAGETIQGYSTVKYRLTYSFASMVSVLGRKKKSTTTATSDIWIAPQLAGLYNPAAGAANQTGGGSETAQTLAAAYAKLPKGAYVKTVTQMQTTGDHASAMTTTMELLNIKRQHVPASVFEVPKDYAKIDMTAALSALGGGGGGGKDGSGNLVGQMADSAKQGARQGATEEVKNQAKDKAKGAIRGLFGRP